MKIIVKRLIKTEKLKQKKNYKKNPFVFKFLVLFFSLIKHLFYIDKNKEKKNRKKIKNCCRMKKINNE